VGRVDLDEAPGLRQVARCAHHVQPVVGAKAAHQGLTGAVVVIDQHQLQRHGGGLGIWHTSMLSPPPVSSDGPIVR
jgi:hypothetical protein